MERCNTDQLTNERNSLKVTSFPNLIVKLIFPYLDCYGAQRTEDAGTGAGKQVFGGDNSKKKRDSQSIRTSLNLYKEFSIAPVKYNDP